MVRVVVSSGFGMLLSSSAALAGAWTLEQGHGQVTVTATDGVSPSWPGGRSVSQEFDALVNPPAWGTALPSEVQVSTIVPSLSAPIAADGNGNGTAAVVWSSGSTLYYNRVTDAGAPVGAPVPIATISTIETSFYRFQDVAVNASGTSPAATAGSQRRTTSSRPDCSTG